MYYTKTSLPISGSSVQNLFGDFILSAARHYEKKKK